MMRTTLALLGMFLAQTTAAQANEKDRFEVGEEVKNFTLKVVNTDEAGEPYVSVERYYGAEAKEPKKAILLSFFATYCEPCKREMPYLGALYNLYKDKGLMILSISIDKEADQIEFIKNLAKQSNVSFPVLSDRFNIVAKRFYISKLPCVYLVTGEGKVAFVNVGYNDDISRALLENIRKSIGEPTTDPVPDVLAKYMSGHPGEATTDAKTEPAPAGAEAAAAAKSAEAAAAEPAAPDTKAKGKAKGKDKGKAKGKGKKKGK
ncbi:MAG: TlpA family protein disulfide reductase [Deltaproteobacteria bacterium]|nr:TlpA family protein disulfide reductase [Deltaproteobacteria bacterium]